MTTESDTAVPQAPVCPCCTFGNHTEVCTCEGSSCCHPAEHGSQRDRLHRQLVAARAEADGLAEAMGNAGRLYAQHLAEERAKTAAARVAALGEAAAAIQDVIDRDRAEFPARSNDRAALGGARELILGLIDRHAEDEPDGDSDELVCVDECGNCDACGMEPFGTPAEGWREAARFLRRTPRDSRDYPAVLTGARRIEDHLRARAGQGEAP